MNHSPNTISRVKASFLWCLIAPLPAGAAQVLVNSYSFASPPGYPDTGGTELINGVDVVPVWATPANPAFSSGDPLVGWEGVDFPSITFSFSGPVNIGSMTAWFADSDGSAGVGMPVTMQLTTPGGFNQSFSVANPAGAGNTVPVTASGFNITTNSLTLTLTRDPGFNADPNLVGPKVYSWTMVSEVKFFTPVPEPSIALLAGLSTLGLVARRRRM